MTHCIVLLSLLVSSIQAIDDPPATEARRPTDDGELKYWLSNMRTYHGYSIDECAAATGLSQNEISAACDKFKISLERPPSSARDKLLVLPYPGGRHPRLGFLEGAVRPQRETKLSVFTPWDPASYVVVDVPEAIWSNLGLTYLAHTHVPTVWSNQNIVLPPLEWNRRSDGSYDITRRLPNGISFGTKVTPGRSSVRMEMWITNGTSEPLSDLRVQMCVMLGRASGFEARTNDNKILSKPYVAARSDTADRWIISAWEPCHRPWANPPCPCLHSDPKLPDCAPGETQTAVGWLSFYEGNDLDGELRRIETTDWSKAVKRD